MTNSLDYNKNLRQRAEAKLEAAPTVAAELTPAEAARLINELQVHQIELEMQNEDLQLSQLQIEESRSRYADLYDCAPVGYLTLSGRGLIVEANLTAAALLGVERHKLCDSFFSHFLVEADRMAFIQLLSNKPPQKKLRREFGVLDVDSGSRTMLLDILFLPDAEEQQQFRIAMTDITERKVAEEALRRAHGKMEQRVQERTAELQRTVEQLQWEIMERQRAEEELRKSEEGLRSLASQLLYAQEIERGRLARELHDDLGQTLLFLRMQLKGILRKYSHEPQFHQSLEQASNYLLGAIDKVRHLTKDLSPPILEQMGLSETLRELLEEFRKYHDAGMTIKADLDDIKDMAPAETSIVIYRITQEFLANVQRHSEATQVGVTIKDWPEKISVTLEDNGKGFDPKEIKSRPRGQRGLGLASMEERLRMLGSRFNLTSQPGKGTRLDFEIFRTEGRKVQES